MCKGLMINSEEYIAYDGVHDLSAVQLLHLPPTSTPDTEMITFLRVSLENLP